MSLHPLRNILSLINEEKHHSSYPYLVAHFYLTFSLQGSGILIVPTSITRVTLILLQFNSVELRARF